MAAQNERKNLSRPAPPFLVALLLLLIGQELARGEEIQQWDEFKIVGKWTKHVDLFAATALRLDEVDPNLNRVSGQLGLALHPVSWLTFTPNFQYIVNDPADDGTNDEHRPGIGTAVALPLGSVEVTVSTAFEYRFREDQPESWRLRPRVKLKHSLGPKSWRLGGYVANELFFDSTKDDFVRDRFFAGLEKKLGRHWNLDLYYCRQHAIRSSDPDLDIFGVSLSFLFDLAKSSKVTPSLSRWERTE